MKPSSSSTLLAERYAEVKALIAKEARACLRSADAIELVAVSKGQPISAVHELYQLGQRAFGESYAQELGAKMAESMRLGMTDIAWHFIGAIQSNKARLIKEAQVVESISSLTHAQLLNQAADHSIDIFLQVNINYDLARQGFAPEDLSHAILALKACPKLKLQGLMMIAPLNTTESDSYWFSKLNMLRQELVVKLERPLALSMGMSNDFQCAIAHGADVLRIGSSIFGPRPKKL